jgi:hypothetical protein
MMKPEKGLRIRNSTAEFLIFTRQAGEDGIEVRLEDETVWLTQKLIGVLFEVTVPTVNEHLANLYAQGEIFRRATIRNFRTVRREAVVWNFRTTWFRGNHDRSPKQSRAHWPCERGPCAGAADLL